MNKTVGAVLLLATAIYGCSQAPQPPPALAPETAAPHQEVVNSFLQGERSRFSSEGQPDALGLNITLDYPSRWALHEGKRRTIVCKFSGEPVGGILPQCMLQVYPLPQKVLDNLPADRSIFVFSRADVHDMLPNGASLVGYTTTQLERCPAAFIDYSITHERAGLKMYSRLSSLKLILDDKMITYELQVVGRSGESETVDGVFRIYEPCFRSIVNSMVIHNRWIEKD